jgi:hypothetical protein
MPPAKTRLLRAVFIFFCASAASMPGQVTESPYTVAPGRILIESDGIKLSFDRAEAAGNTYTAVGVASTIVTAGLTSSVDLQVGADLFLRRVVNVGGVRDSRSGLGDLFFRAKWTFWRDESLGEALAVLPYVKLPANTGGVGNKSLEGGLIVPWAMKLGEGLSAGAMFRWDAIRNDDDTGYDARWQVSGFALRNLTREFAFYGEATMVAFSTGLSDWAGSLGVGALLQATKRLQLDYELQHGLNSHATDWTHTFRINWEW